MAIHLVTYADWRFSLQHKYAQEHQIATACDIGIKKENIHIWNRKRLMETTFYKNHKYILNERKGAGLWLYNPFLTYMYLKKLDKNDILIYADADIPFVGQLDPLIAVCKANNGIFHAKNKHYNIYYTKRYCFKEMQCDIPAYHWITQITAGFVILQKNSFTMKFYDEFLHLCCNKKLVDDGTYGVKNYKQFIEHRHPVSVLTNLYQKYGLNAFCAPVDPDLFFEKYTTNEHEYKDIFNNEEKKLNFTYLGTQLLGGQVGSMNNKKRLSMLKTKAAQMKQRGIQWKKDQKNGFILIGKN